jgi:hypothetical protein
MRVNFIEGFLVLCIQAQHVAIFWPILDSCPVVPVDTQARTKPQRSFAPSTILTLGAVLHFRYRFWPALPGTLLATLPEPIAAIAG